MDPATARRTVEEAGRQWNWDATWGWDFPWMAMAAARVGDPKLAIEALLNPSRKNHYDERGICTGGPGPYLPGNGGLLYAVAMMAAGWDGAFSLMVGPLPIARDGISAGNFGPPSRLPAGDTADWQSALPG